MRLCLIKQLNKQNSVSFTKNPKLSFRGPPGIQQTSNKGSSVLAAQEGQQHLGKCEAAAGGTEATHHRTYMCWVSKIWTAVLLCLDHCQEAGITLAEHLLSERRATGHSRAQGLL